MGIFSFFARNDNSEALSQPEVDLTIDNMCSQVEYLQAELLRATNLCELANKQFDDFRKQIEKYKSEAQNLKKTNADLWTRLEARNVRLIELNEAQRWLDAERLKRITVSQESLAFEEEAIKNGLAVRALTKSNPSLPNNVQSLEEAASLPAQPFVILLVDGDQYSFADHLMKRETDAGAVIAQSLWIEISKYILTSSHIPCNAKIVVRIYYNGRATLGLRVSKNNNAFARQYTKVEEIMVKFAETAPLFDFIDVGGGKERADDKIKENAHLYIANRDCAAVLLAICRDNGYARLLERYQHNPVAMRKIVLVANGHVAREVAALNFETIRMPRIFKDIDVEFASEAKQPSVLRCSLEPEHGSIIQPGQIAPLPPTASNATGAPPPLPARQRPTVKNGSPVPRAPKQLPLPPMPGPIARQPAQVLQQAPTAVKRPIIEVVPRLRMFVPGLDKAILSFHDRGPKTILQSFPKNTRWQPRKKTKTAKQKAALAKVALPDFDGVD